MGRLDKGGTCGLYHVSCWALKFSDTHLDLDFPHVGWSKKDLIFGVREFGSRWFFQIVGSCQRVNERVGVKEKLHNGRGL